MEIFKVASQQIDNSVALNTKQNSNQTREVEQAKIQQNVAQERSNQNKGNNEQDSKRISDIVNNMETLNTNIRFGFNDKISSMYVSVTEADSGKVIRKIPTEEIMKLTEHFKEIVGVIFDKKE
uniref:FlaG family protein n=1 Tax=Campylobacter fetus TaxID=196 RepID=UPI003AF75875